MGDRITGTWIVYPWYRVKLAGADFARCDGLELPSSVCSPRDFLLSNVVGETEKWHEFGMEWKEHVAWAAPILATSAFLLVLHYGPRIIARPWLRTAIIVMLVGAFAAAAVGGAFGALHQQGRPELMSAKGTHPSTPHSATSRWPRAGAAEPARQARRPRRRDDDLRRDRDLRPRCADRPVRGLAVYENMAADLGVGKGRRPARGQTTLATLAYFASLALLRALWRKKDFNLKLAFYVGLGLGVLGALLTFPTFYQMFTTA